MANGGNIAKLSVESPEKSHSLATDWGLTSMESYPGLCMCGFFKCVYLHIYVYISKY